MALLSNDEVRLRILATGEGAPELDTLSSSAENLETNLQQVGEAARLSAEKQADAASRLQKARVAQDDIRLALISAQNGYRALATRAKESGVAQELFAKQAQDAKNRVAELKQELAVARGNVSLISREHREAAKETRSLAGEQHRLKVALAEAREEAQRSSHSFGALKTGAKAVAGAFAGIELARGFVDANLSIEATERALTQITGSADGARQEIDWLREVTNRLGIETDAASRAWIALAASAKGTAMEGEPARDVFEAVAGAMAKLGKSSADTEGALQAVAQMISKGVVSMEEMRQQLGERLPGAFQATAEAMGMSVAELSSMIETGNVLAEDLLPKLAAGLEKAYGTGEKVAGTVSAWNRMKNAVAETFQLIGQSGPMQAAGAAVEGLAKTVRLATGAFENLGAQIGILGGALATFDWSHPIESIKAWRAASVEAGEEIAKRMGLAEDAMKKTAAAQAEAGAAAGAAGQLAGDAAVGWNTVANAFGKVAGAAKESVALAEKTAATRAEEAKAALGLAAALGSEAEKRGAALDAAVMNREALQAVAAARQQEATVAMAQVEAMQAVAAAAGVESAAKEKAIKEAQQKAAALQEEAARAAAAALSAQQHAAALEVEARALKDNSQRIDELKAAHESAAATLEVVRINAEAGAATMQQLNAAEIEAARAAALYRDALADQTLAIQQKARETQSAITLDQAQIRLAIEQQKTILDVANARGDEMKAAAASNKIRELEIKLAELNAKAKAEEAKAVLASAKAKLEEYRASGVLTEQRKAEIAALEASAKVKEVEAQILDETAKRMRELAQVTADGAASARGAAKEYGGLADALDGVTNAAERAADAQAAARGETRATGTMFDPRTEAQARGLPSDVVDAVTQRYDDLVKEAFDGKRFNNKVIGEYEYRKLYDQAVRDLSPAIAKSSRGDYETRATAQRQPVQVSTFRVDLTFNGGNRTEVSVASRTDAEAIDGFFRRIEADMARAR